MEIEIDESSELLIFYAYIFTHRSDVDHLLQVNNNLKCYYPHKQITSVVPGGMNLLIYLFNMHLLNNSYYILDFDGDAFMDVMFTTKEDEKTGVYVSWGGSDHLNCSHNASSPLITMIGEPLALDFNDDMIIDLFGMNEKEERTFWIFDKSRGTPKAIKMESNLTDTSKLNKLHSHAFLDLNDDFHADLFIRTNNDRAEIWLSEANLPSRFAHSETITFGVGTEHIYGQSIFVDLELDGNLNHLMPVCYNKKCSNSTIWVHSGVHFHNLNINFYQDDNKTLWGFVQPDRHGEFFKRAITLRTGDFNNDGYPDLLCTLEKPGGVIQTFFLENVKNENARPSDKFKRTFVVRWDALQPFGENTIMGSFYDFFQDGILDVVMLQKNGDKYKPLAFRNTLDYDANFVKVIVLTGLTNPRPPAKQTPFGAKRRNYGTNLPGPRIKYYTTTQEGIPQHGGSCQLPQSAYFSLHLPYTIFGLGRTPNFVDFIEIGLATYSRRWPQTIPNSQLFVIPSPINRPKDWKIQLFVTPSKIIIKSVFALLGICLVISLIIIVLHIKERRQDKIEKLQEAQRFHFDAM